ncbi:MAG: O-antigen ligase family protein [Bacteroidetes bacterium]|nr:O-antigen ligase family protein [Bacteroidota bacterium]
MNKPLFLRHNYLYVFGLIVLVTGLPLSLFLISLSQFILAGSFFLEGNFIEKFKRFSRNKAAMLVAGIWLLHVVGLFWTTDLSQGWDDIRIKLPILVLTLIIAGNEPLTKKQFHLVLSCFIAAVFAGSLVSIAVLTGVIHREVLDIRDVFIFKISHIRFGLFTCIAILCIFYFVFINKAIANPLYRFGVLLLALWLFIFLVIVESLTGLSVLIIIFSLLFISHAWKQQAGIGKIMLIVAFIAVPAVLFYQLNKTYKEKYALRYVFIDMNAKTALGNYYAFDLKNPEVENGFPAYIYMCEEEMRNEWSKRSIIHYDSLDKKGQPLKYTLMRFLASKGLRKDSAAVASLGNKEIKSIESGIPNVDYQNPSVKVRLLELLWEVNQSIKGGDPNGHSIMQRIESWKAACNAISGNLFFGAGTGDLPNEVHRQYELMNSKLNSYHYLRAHNQYLAIAVAFGVFGFAYFLFAICYPMLFLEKKKNFLYLVFFLTLALSMLTEDTLETQPGATFFAFFNALFLYALPKENDIKQG